MPASVTYSASTWQQPVPEPASAQRGALIALLAGRIAALGRGRLRVGVDGRTGSGKTSFGHELAIALAAANRPVLRGCLDDFKRPWREAHRYDRISGEGYYRNAFDYAALRELLLEPAAADGNGHCVLCLRDPLTQQEHRDLVTVAPPDAVLVLDGVFAFRPEIDDCWDFRVRLEIPEGLAVRRGVRRDTQMEGHAAALALHRDRYGPSERVYLAEVDAIRLADVVIDNSDFALPRIHG